MKTPSLRLIVLFVLVFAPIASSPAADSKPVFLYSRHFNAVGEDRYLPDGNYKDLLQRLGKDFDVRANDQPLTAETLAGVSVVLVANPSDKAVANNPPPHHFAERDIAALTDFVKRGGGLIVMGNQENHNLEVEDTNKLLRQFGLQFTNLYTDAKLLPLPKTTPIIGELRWAYYTGNQVRIESFHPAKPRALVMNDLGIKPAKGPRDEAGALLAVAEPGQGHVVVVTDAGWVTDFAFNEKGVGGVALKGQDNWEIFHRLARWAAGLRSAL
jgi:unsaturated rhamnogalacturonyl hydrolase